jgi:hypothetical protein
MAGGSDGSVVTIHPRRLSIEAEPDHRQRRTCVRYRIDDDSVRYRRVLAIHPWRLNIHRRAQHWSTH